MKEIGGKAHKVKVKMKEKMSDKGRVTQKGRSEGGWILGKNGFYTADPKWTGGNDTFSGTVSLRSVEQPSKDSITLVDKVALGSTRVHKAKKKPTLVTGTSVYCMRSKAERKDSDVGGFAKTIAAVERDGFALVPDSFPETWRQSGDPGLGVVARKGLEQVEASEPNLFWLHDTKTYKYVPQGSVHETSLKAIRVRPKSDNIHHPSVPEIGSGRKLVLNDGKNGSSIREAHIPSPSTR